jgi:hypothetical protein
VAKKEKRPSPAVRKAVSQVAIRKRWDNAQQTAKSASALGQARQELARLRAEELRRRADETLVAAGLDPDESRAS